MYENVVWDYLMQHGVSLTKDVLETAVEDLCFSVSPMSSVMPLMVSLQINFDVLVRDGYSFIDPENNRHIVYKNDLPRDMSNYVILHEIGHFVINRSFGGSFADKEENTQQKEWEANQFVYAYYPSPVLYEAGIREMDTIKRFTQLDDTSVSAIYQRVQSYGYRRSHTKEEKEICEFYRDFIEEYKAENPIDEEPEESNIDENETEEVEEAIAETDVDEESQTTEHQCFYTSRLFRAVSVLFVTVTAVLSILLCAGIAGGQNSPSATLPSTAEAGLAKTVVGRITATIALDIQPATTETTATTTTTTIVPTTTTTTRELQTYLAPGTIVYVTKEGDRYHLPGCYHTRGKTNLIEMTVEQAEIAGYEPCKDCVE